MKTLYRILLLLIFAITTSCEKIEIEFVPLEVETYYINFNNSACHENLRIQAAEKPIIDTPSWITFSILKIDEENHMWMLTLNLSVNPTQNERKGTITVSCFEQTALINIVQNENNDDEKEEVIDSPKNVLLAIQKTYRALSWYDTDSDITILFHDPHPITLEKDYPEGIESVTIPKNVIKRFNSNSEFLEIYFTSGEYVKILFDMTPRDTPEGLLNKIQNSYEILSVYETDGEIELFFYEPKPISLIQDYPNGIEKISVPRRIVKEFKDNIKFVEFTFNSGKYVKINTASFPISIELEKNTIVKDSYDIETMEWNSDTINFKVTCPRPEKLKVTIEDGRYFKYELTKLDDLGNFSIIITNQHDYIRPSVVITASNGIDRKETMISCNFKTVECGISEAELKKGLIALYEACNGSAWTRNGNWCSDKPVNQWAGITYSENYTPFNDTRTVKSFQIDICEDNLCGVIPDEFWECCKYASFIRIYGKKGCLVDSEMPEKAWSKFVRCVDFWDTGIKVNINHAINSDKLTTIEFIGCNAAPLSEEFFNHSFPYLEILSVEFKENSIIPSNVGNLATNSPLITNLLLLNTHGECPTSVFEITTLEELWLTGKLIGDISPSIEKMKNLKQLILGLYSKNGKIPNEVGNCKKLTKVQLGQNLKEFPEAVKYIPAGWNMKGYSPFTNLSLYEQQDLEGNKYELNMPEWYAERYGVTYWSQGHKKHPTWPNGDDLEYPADEIFWINGQWQHRPEMKYTGN